MCKQALESRVNLGCFSTQGVTLQIVVYKAMQFGEIVKFLAMFEGILVLLVQLLMVKLRVPFVIPMVSVSITRE